VKALYSNTGDDNTAMGVNALYSNTTGEANTVIGADALANNSTGSANIATGIDALFNNTFGSANVAVGPNALGSNTTGNYNIAVGPGAGSNVTTGDNNIDIGNFDPGTSTSTDVAGEANTIRIGIQGTQTATFVAGITGVTVSSPSEVVIDGNNGQLGTVPLTSVQGSVLLMESGIPGPTGYTRVGSTSIAMSSSSKKNKGSSIAVDVYEKN
jgi:hypothetical protein